MVANRVIEVGEHDDMHVRKAAAWKDVPGVVFGRPGGARPLIEIEGGLVELDALGYFGQLNEDEAKFFECVNIVRVLLQY
jgi:hypothetical protein